MNIYLQLHLIRQLNINLLTYISPDLPCLFSLLYCVFIILQTRLSEEARRQKKVRKAKISTCTSQKSFCIQLKTLHTALQSTTFTGSILPAIVLVLIWHIELIVKKKSYVLPKRENKMKKQLPPPKKKKGER